MGKRVRSHTSNFRSLGKCGKRSRSREDRISQLPDEILVSILSYLTLKQAGATSVLSKRWRCLWMFTSRLNFDAEHVLAKSSDEPEILKKERPKYVKWVKDVLGVHKSSMLEEFRICFDMDIKSKNSIDNWLKFALARGVQSLELNLLRQGEYLGNLFTCYPFPRQFLVKSSANGWFVGFKSLESLCFKCVNVCGETLQFFLSNCPVLERLVVKGSRALVNLDVAGHALVLKYLEIVGCPKVKSIKISDVNLVSFKIRGVAKNILLKNVPLLAEVFYEVGRETMADVFSKLSCCLHQLEVLTLEFPEVEEDLELLELPQLTKLKTLVIKTRALNDESLMGFASLIRASPYMEKFVLKQEWLSDIRKKARKSIGKSISSSPHRNLKVVELGGYSGRISDLEFAIYFLENAVALEKVIIDPRNQFTLQFPEDGDDESAAEELARTRAKRQLKGKVPPKVELVIL